MADFRCQVSHAKRGIEIHVTTIPLFPHKKVCATIEWERDGRIGDDRAIKCTRCWSTKSEIAIPYLPVDCTCKRRMPKYFTKRGFRYWPILHNYLTEVRHGDCEKLLKINFHNSRKHTEAWRSRSSLHDIVTLKIGRDMMHRSSS